MGIFGPPNIEKLKAKKNIEKLIKALQHKSIEIREASITALGEIGDSHAVGPLINTLNNKRNNDSIRCAVAESLGKIGDPLAIEPLIAMLRYKEIKETAAVALGKMGQSATKPLTDILNDRNEINYARLFAAKALGDIGDKKAIESLITALNEKNQSIRCQAADSLQKIGWQTDDIKTKASYLCAKEQWSHCIKIGAPAVEYLILYLGQINIDGDSVNGVLVKIGKPAVEELIKFFNDQSKSERNRVYAARILGRIGDKRSTEPLIASLNNKNEYKSIHKEAAIALGIIRDPHSIKPLIATLSSKEKDLRENAAYVLGKIGIPSGGPLIKIINNKTKSMDVRICAIKALGYIIEYIKSKKAKESFIDEFKDKVNHKQLISVYEKAALSFGSAADLVYADYRKTDEYELKRFRSASQDYHHVEKIARKFLVRIGRPAVESIVPLLDSYDNTIREFATATLKDITKKKW